MSLFRIHACDGVTHISKVTDEQVIKEINEEESDGSKYLTELPKEADTNYWPGEVPMLLIRGEIVSPKPKTTVKIESWEIK